MFVSLLLVPALVRDTIMCFCSLFVARVAVICQCYSFVFASRALVISGSLLSAVCARCSMLLSFVVVRVRCCLVLLVVRKRIRVMCSSHVFVFVVSVILP